MLPTIDQPVSEGSLTKAALVEQVAHVAGLTKKRAEIIVDTVFGNIAAALQQGEKVELRGWAAERTDHSREVIEAALAHVVPNKVEAAYARSDLFERRRFLMDDYMDASQRQGQPGVHGKTSCLPPWAL